jgi:hypothetical protein
MSVRVCSAVALVIVLLLIVRSGRFFCGLVLIDSFGVSSDFFIMFGQSLSIFFFVS